jgi:hypothetical protein
MCIVIFLQLTNQRTLRIHRPKYSIRHRNIIIYGAQKKIYIQEKKIKLDIYQ